MAAKKAQGWRTMLPRRVAELRRTLEKRVRKGWEEATGMLPPAPRKAVKRMTADVERLRHDLMKRGEKVVTEARKRAERAGADLQKRVERAVTPLASRLDVASRGDVERLRKRVHELERRIESHGHAPSAAA
jgi:polyhydroxyalkanoate synthesis regulator phasin